MNILSPFEFSNQQIGLVFARFGIELLLSAVLIWLTAIIMIKATKNKEHECGFTNYAKLSLMYGITVAFLVINLILILMIRGNGLYYFDFEYISWSFYSGYPLIIPELVIDVTLVILYFVLQSRIKNSLNR